MGTTKVARANKAKSKTRKSRSFNSEHTDYAVKREATNYGVAVRKHMPEPRGWK